MLKRPLKIFVALLWSASLGQAQPAGGPSAPPHESVGPQNRARAIVRLRHGTAVAPLLYSVDATVLQPLPPVDGFLVDVPVETLGALARDPRVLSVSPDRPVRAAASSAVGSRQERTSIDVPADVDGSGIGIALIDSGITGWHDDLTTAGTGQRVAHFVDFVQQGWVPYDDYGHGTHVAGIVAGNGYDSEGARAGVAPGATLIALKVLNAAGHGHISDVIAAIDYAILSRERHNIRILNVSVAADVTESYTTDPLTLAAKRAVAAGLVVVAAAGNLGMDAAGRPVHGGITAPGNAPWVIAVGAADPQVGPDRPGLVAAFSSRGPTRFDRLSKPDLVAPGVGIESLSEPGSTLYNARPQRRVWGSLQTAAPPYFRMSGTSMAAPVVTGAVALMLEANPALTPGAVLDILRFTARPSPRHDRLTQGAGWLDIRAAVDLSRSLAERAGGSVAIRRAGQ